MITLIHLKLMLLYVTYLLNLSLHLRKVIPVITHARTAKGKCTAKGKYIHDRACYPYLKSFPLRTDDDFRQKLQRDHHTGTSILESIPNIDMVKGFPSDSMHLLFLGIVKKLIVKLWCFGTPRSKI